MHLLPWLLAVNALQTPASVAPGASLPAATAGQSEGEPFAIGGAVSMPEKVRGGDPQYTKDALKNLISGTVAIALWVEKDGTTSHVTVLHGLGHGLDEAAQEAVRRWVFKPALREGQPVTVHTAVNVRFVLEGG